MSVLPEFVCGGSRK